MSNAESEGIALFDLVRTRTEGAHPAFPLPAGETGVVAGASNTGYLVRFFKYPTETFHVETPHLEYLKPADGQQLSAVGLFESAWDAGMFTLTDGGGGGGDE